MASRNALPWIRLVRTEGHDSDWAYRDAFFELPPSHFVSRFPLEAAGLVIEALREPPLGGVDIHRRTRMPLFPLWRAVKLAGHA
jgi:hypothetical protein